MIIRCLHHLLPLRKGGKVIIINQPNSLLHKEGSHTPVSYDSSQYSVGSACFVLSPNREWKRLHHQPACTDMGKADEELLGLNQGAPTEHFGESTDDHHSQYLPDIWTGQLMGFHPAKTACQPPPPRHLSPGAAQQLPCQAVGARLLPSAHGAASTCLWKQQNRSKICLLRFP